MLQLMPDSSTHQIPSSLGSYSPRWIIAPPMLFYLTQKRTGAKTTYVTAILCCSLLNIREGECPPYVLAVFANCWFLLIAES
jgi:hypothetical protein